MPLRVINHFPEINAVDVPRNVYVKVEFNSGIIPGSLEYTHISVNDSTTFATVPGELGVEYTSSGIASVVVFQPLINFTANTKYKVYVFGAPNSVLSVGNEQLPTTYSWEFTAGSTLLEGQVPEGIPSGTSDLSGVVTDSGIVYPVISGTLLISGIYPTNMTPNVDPTLEYIRIAFNKEVTSTPAELSGLISVQVKDVLY